MLTFGLYTQPYLDDNGNQAGETVFVLLDCNTNTVMPKEVQDPIYQFPGVSNTAVYKV